MVSVNAAGFPILFRKVERTPTILFSWNNSAPTSSWNEQNICRVIGKLIWVYI